MVIRLNALVPKERTSRSGADRLPIPLRLQPGPDGQEATSTRGTDIEEIQHSNETDHGRPSASRVSIAPRRLRLRSKR